MTHGCSDAGMTVGITAESLDEFDRDLAAAKTIAGFKLIVASWGMLNEPGTFNISKLGDVLKVDLKPKAIVLLSREAGNLEGITKADKFYDITD